jgi:hypothetical protein
MKRFFFIVLFTLFLKASAGEKDLKILVLIISSDGIYGDGDVFQPYKVMENTWRTYMHSDPEHVEAYFIRADPDLPVQSTIKGDVIWSKTQESLNPGILRKTLLSMEHMLPRLREFDYIVRPNLSSFFVFPRLLEFLKTAPKERCYCGHNMGHFATGCGFILSPDLVEMLVEQKDELWNSSWNDDVSIGFFFGRRGIPILDVDWLLLDQWELWEQARDHIPPHIFHFRTKNAYRNRHTHELLIQSELLQMFYGKTRIGDPA